MSDISQAEHEQQEQFLRDFARTYKFRRKRDMPPVTVFAAALGPSRDFNIADPRESS